MLTNSASRVHRRWSFGVVIVLLVSFVSVAFANSPLVYGIDDHQSSSRMLSDSTVDFEVGENDFRISDMGDIFDFRFDGYEPAIAYNSINDEYLVVWHGNDAQSYGDEHVYGQRIDGVTGAEIGSDVQISSPNQYGARVYDVDIAYNQIEKEYLVVWLSYVDTGGYDPPSRPGIFARLVDATTGEAIGEQFQVDQEDVGPKSVYEPNYPTVAYNPLANEYLVTWSGNRAQGITYEIFGQRLAANGDQLGVDDFQISDMGPDGAGGYGGFRPDVTYNITNDEYVVVWEGEDNTGDLVEDEREVFGQRLNGTTGAEVGENDFRISNMGPDGDTHAWARTPSVIYNLKHNEYVIVWTGKDNIDEEESHFAIYGQRLDAETGAEIDDNDFLVSSSNGSTGLGFWSVVPDIAYAEASDTYLVVWTGTPVNATDGEFEIVGQQLNRLGQKIGANEFRISDMGADNNAAYRATLPTLIYNPTIDEYLTVWQGDDDTPPLINDEYEIFGQRLDATDGSELGENDFRISSMGPDGDTDYDADSPAVAYNSIDNEYLAVWSGDNNIDEMADDEREVFAQRIDAATGEELGINDFRVSQMGFAGEGEVFAPAVTYNSETNQYLVIWYGRPSVDNAFEIYGQLLSATGQEIGPNDFRISDMETDLNDDLGAFSPDVTYNPIDNEYLVAWQGRKTIGQGNAIYGQRLSANGEQIGTDDFQISDVNQGDNTSGAFNPAVVHNATDNGYLITWSSSVLEDEDLRIAGIYGQRLDATGAEVGANDFRIDQAANNDFAPTFSASVSYSSTDNTYLVAWVARSDNTQAILGQQLDATGTEIGTDDFPIASAEAELQDVALTYNVIDNEHLVVWVRNDNADSEVPGGRDIFGQRVDSATGTVIGTSAFRVSDMAYGAFVPDVGYSTTNNQYLVAWHGADDVGNLLEDENEIFGQRLRFEQELRPTATPTASSLTPTSPPATPTATPPPSGPVPPEIGANDFRISDMGPDGVPDYDAEDTVIAYNSRDNEYLVVWSGKDTNPDPGENDIHGQRIDAATGTEVGENDFRISTTGRSSKPDVVYNSTTNQYLVVWRNGNRNSIYGQRLNAAGQEIGTDDFPITNESRPFFGGVITYNSNDNQYLLIWEKLDHSGDHTIVGQRLDESGLAIDETAFIISDVHITIHGFDVGYNSIENEYLITWSGASRGKSGVFAQRLEGTTGAEVGPDNFRISDMEPGSYWYFAHYEPTVAYNSHDNEYLVTWSGSDTFDGEFESYGQRLDGATGAELGPNDFRISDMGPDGDPNYEASGPTVIYNGVDNEYLVTWFGDDSVFRTDVEIYGQRIDGATGAELGPNDFRMSDMGPDGDPNSFTFFPAVAHSSVENAYLVTWEGVDMIPEEREIFGQRLSFQLDPPPTVVPTVTPEPTVVAPTPTPTTSPACDPARDVWGKIRGLGWVEIGNRGQTCTYPVGGAIYIIPSGDINDPDIDSQEWYDDTTAEVGPGARIIIRVDVPTCAVVQQDAFWGAPLKSLEGQRYGERLLAAARYHISGECEPTPTPVAPSLTPEPTTPMETATPEVPSLTASAMVPTATSPAASPTATLAMPTSTSVAPTPTATVMPEVISPARSSRVFIPLIER